MKDINCRVTMFLAMIKQLMLPLSQVNPTVIASEARQSNSLTCKLLFSTITYPTFIYKSGITNQQKEVA